MAQPHALSGSPVSLDLLSEALPSTRTTVILMGQQVEVARLVLKAEERLREQRAPGEATVLIFESELEFGVTSMADRIRLGRLHPPCRR